jgi:hypothetical protein
VSDVLTPTGWSPDGDWFWDGRIWNDAVSPDGKYRFDGKVWKSFRGKRSIMPAEPLGPPPVAPMSQPPAVEMPSWVAASEVDRLAKEKQERAALAAMPQQMPPPPELDWRRAGEHMEHSRMVRVYGDWQVGPTSIAYFLLLYMLCAPASVVFIWRSGWRFRNKLVVTFLSLFGPALVFFLVTGSGLGHTSPR